MEDTLIEINDKVYIVNITDFGDGDIRYRVLNSSNQVVEMTFTMFCCDMTNRAKYYCATLSVNKKSKGYEYGKVTGKSGIESLIIGKEILKLYMEYIRSKKFTNKIFLWADDTRRLKVYERGLRDLGFKLGRYTFSKRYDSGKCLYKVI